MCLALFLFPSYQEGNKGLDVKQIKKFLYGAGVIIVVLCLCVTGTVEAKFMSGGRGEKSSVSLAGLQKDSMAETVAFVLNHYKLDNGMYPTTEQGLQSLVRKPTVPPLPSHWKGPYLGSIPVNSEGKLYTYTCPGVRNKDGYDLTVSDTMAPVLKAKGEGKQKTFKKNVFK